MADVFRTPEWGRSPFVASGGVFGESICQRGSHVVQQQIRERFDHLIAEGKQFMIGSGSERWYVARLAVGLLEQLHPDQCLGILVVAPSGQGQSLDVTGDQRDITGGQFRGRLIRTVPGGRSAVMLRGVDVGEFNSARVRTQPPPILDSG